MQLSLPKQISLVSKMPCQSLVFQYQKNPETQRNSTSSIESLESFLPRCQTDCPNKLNLLQIEKSIVKYLKKIGLKTKTDPLDKSQMYRTNQKFKLISFREQDNSIDLTKERIPLNFITDLGCIQNYYENTIDQTPMTIRNQEEKHKNVSTIPQIKLVSYREDGDSFEASVEQTPMTSKNEFDLSQNPFLLRRQKERTNSDGKFSKFLRDHKLDVQDVQGEENRVIATTSLREVYSNRNQQQITQKSEFGEEDHTQSEQLEGYCQF